jgi:peptidyl-prolyl cis-trans isomerase B (cyclophilin B)
MLKLITLFLFSTLLVGCQTQNSVSQNKLDTLPTIAIVPSSTPLASASATSSITKDSPMNATVTTSKGSFVIALDALSAPKTVDNFVSKAKSDFYKNLTFHRVEDWVVQGGDPDGNGTGGGSMPTELSKTPFVRGSVGVARGMDINISNDAQFFICTKDCDWLTGAYTLFGQVTEGMEVVDAMEIGDTITGISLE